MWHIRRMKKLLMKVSRLNDHGFNIEGNTGSDYYSMSLEKLMETKETIEDIIAEKDLSGVTIVSTEDK